MKDEEEKKTTGWEVCDPKPPVIHSGRRVADHGPQLMTRGYPTYPNAAQFDAVIPRLAE